jgi:hypothetical protein
MSLLFHLASIYFFIYIYLYLFLAGKYDEAERQFKAVLSLYRPTTSSPLINAITRLSPPSELISGSSLASTPPSLASVMAAGLPANLDQEIEVDEEMERQRLRDELKLSKLGSTDSHGLQVRVVCRACRECSWC